MKTDIEQTNVLKLVECFAAGKTITDTAKELNIDRGTIYQWLSKPTFQAYYNQILAEIKQHTKENLLSLYTKALSVISDCLESKNENIRLKTALSIIERVENTEIGETNPIEIIKTQCTSYADDIDFGKFFDKNKFNQLCKENGIKP